MKKHWLYLKYVLRHKWFVLLEGMTLGVPLWMLIIHDWGKFLPGEWFPYVDFFHGEYIVTATRKRWINGGASKDASLQQIEDEIIEERKLAFYTAWQYHVNRNKHHWQYWVTSNESDVECLPMPEVHRLEMLADWRGAGRAQGTPDTRKWYASHRNKLKLHPETRQFFDRTLSYAPWPDISDVSVMDDYGHLTEQDSLTKTPR